MVPPIGYAQFPVAAYPESIHELLGSENATHMHFAGRLYKNPTVEPRASSIRKAVQNVYGPFRGAQAGEHYVSAATVAQKKSPTTTPPTTLQT